MGGIIGIVGKTDVAPLLLESLAGFEDPRGNSCGLAVLGEAMGIDLRKDVGPVDEVAGRCRYAIRARASWASRTCGGPPMGVWRRKMPILT